MIALPLLILVLPLLDHSGAYSNFGDVASMEVGVQRAADLQQQVGPYSRFGWNHPGPAVFYLMALPYRMLGREGEGLVVATVAINAAASLGVVMLIGRRGGGRAALMASTAVSGFWLILSMEQLANAWSPLILVLPTSFCLVRYAHAVGGHRWSLSGSVFAGSLLVQTHVGMTAVVLAGLGMTLVWFLVRQWRQRESSEGRFLEPKARMGLIAAILVGAIMWVPPLWQEFTGSPGNMTALARFFRHSGGDHGVVEAAAGLGSGMLIRPAADHMSEDVGALSGGAYAFVAVVVLLTILVGMGLVRRKPRAVALAAISLAAALVAFVSLLRVEGGINGYMVLWAGVITLGALLAALLSLPPAMRVPHEQHPAQLVGTGLLMVAAVAVSLSSVQEAADVDVGAGYTNVTAATEAVTDVLTATDGPVLLCISSSGAWPIAAGVVADLRRMETDVRVQSQWVHTFGDHLQPSGDERVLIEVDTVLSPERPLVLGAPERTAASADLRARRYRANGDAVSETMCPEVL